MSSLFDDLKEGLEEAIAYEKGTGKAKEKKISLLMYILAVLFVLKYIFL